MTRSILISGAGSGLGRAMAVLLCSHGHKVAGLGRRVEALNDTAGDAGQNFLPLPCDVSDAQAVREAFARAAEAHGPVDVLVNNAAVYPRRDTLDETAESFMHSVNINLGGMVNCIHAALPAMVEKGSGRILNVATFADIAPLPASSAYAVSKGAARILTRALLADLGDRLPDIVIGDWMPGMLATDMGIPDGIAPEQAARWGASLALTQERSFSGAVFEQDREVLPPRGIKTRLKDALLMRRPRPRCIAPL